jgi:hypothetical protein
MLPAARQNLSDTLISIIKRVSAASVLCGFTTAACTTVGLILFALERIGMSIVYPSALLLMPLLRESIRFFMPWSYLHHHNSV